MKDTYFKMDGTKLITKNRLEAFSDGVIAIIITVMVFDLKFDQIPTKENFQTLIVELLPRFLTYIFSFLMIAIMWVNHHQLFHQIKHADRMLLWHNIHLLFWMSVIPFATNVLGSNPELPQGYLIYGLIFTFCAVSFTLLRHHLVKKGLLHETISLNAQKRVKRKNYLAILLYLLASILGFHSIFLSIGLLIIVPTMYFIPENIIHEKE